MRTLTGLILAAALVLAALPAQAASLNKVAALVNGEMITMYDVQALATPEILKAGLDRSNPAHQAGIQRILRETLENMISDTLISQEAERMKVSVSDSEVDNELRKLQQRSQLTKEEFEKQALQQGISIDVMRDRLRKGILRHRLLGMMIARKVVVTREEIAKYYEEHKSQFVADRQVRLGLVIFPPSADVAALAKKVKSGELSFEKLAAENSIGPNPQQGGDIGNVRWNDLALDWRDRLADLKPGDTSEVFSLEGRKAMLKVFKRSDGTGQDLDAVADEIEGILREPKLQERYVEYSQQLRNRAVVDIRM